MDGEVGVESRMVVDVELGEFVEMQDEVASGCPV